MSRNLRPGIINDALWGPARPGRHAWERLRKRVLEEHDYRCIFCGHRALSHMNIHHLGRSDDNSPENLAPACVACHAVLHIGFNLQNGVIEIWKCEIPQVDVVRRTRAGAARRLSLAAIKRALPLKRGPYPPGSPRYANELLKEIRDTNIERASLPEPLSAIFVSFKLWQLEG
jgi:hypothetical protein